MEGAEQCIDCRSWIGTDFIMHCHYCHSAVCSGCAEFSESYGHEWKGAQSAYACKTCYPIRQKQIKEYNHSQWRKMMLHYKWKDKMSNYIGEKCEIHDKPVLQLERDSEGFVVKLCNECVILK